MMSRSKTHLNEYRSLLGLAALPNRNSHIDALRGRRSIQLDLHQIRGGRGAEIHQEIPAHINRNQNGSLEVLTIPPFADKVFDRPASIMFDCSLTCEFAHFPRTSEAKISTFMKGHANLLELSSQRHDLASTF
jgi:hypothetical protein